MITTEQAAEHLELVVDGLNLLATVAGGKAAHTAATIASVTRGVITALSARVQGADVDAEKAIEALRAELADNDADADASLASKFAER